MALLNYQLESNKICALAQSSLLYLWEQVIINLVHLSICRAMSYIDRFCLVQWQLRILTLLGFSMTQRGIYVMKFVL